MIRAGDDVKIIDNKSKEDLTSVTLAQIIFEEEKKQRSFLSLKTMRDIIQNGGESFAQFVNEAQKRVGNIIPRKNEDGEDLEETAEIIDDELDQEVGVDEDETYASHKRSRDGLREFREWIQQSQKAVDDFQKKMDGRIRNVVEGITPLSNIQRDMMSLVDRIKGLEAKLTEVTKREKENAEAADASVAESAAVEAEETAETAASAE